MAPAQLAAVPGAMAAIQSGQHHLNRPDRSQKVDDTLARILRSACAYAFDAGIRLVTSTYPAVSVILAMSLIFLYPLDKSRMARVESDLNKRRQHLHVD
jgi:hypothetical protein